MRNFITEAMLLARLAAAAATHISGDMRVIGVRESLQAATASDVLSKAIDAIGGLVALNMVAGVTYHSSLFRSQTLTQNYNLFQSDQSVSEAGSQNVSFQFGGSVLQQRLDRTYRYGDYWIWAFPHLDPNMNYSLVLQAGDDGFACFNRGQNSFFTSNPSQPLGYADSFLTDYLIHSAQQLALPYLMKRFYRDKSSLLLSCSTDKATGVNFSTLRLPGNDLALLLDQRSFLPFAVRSSEEHLIFGPSTSDMVFSDYRPVDVEKSLGLHLPHRVQTVYNSESVIEDFLIDKISINPEFSTDFFEPLLKPAKSSVAGSSSPNAPRSDSQYPRSEVHKFFETGLWGGPFGDFYNSSSVFVAPVFPNGSTPQIMNLFVGYPDYIQLLVEVDGGLIITDAPAFRSTMVLEWVRDNMGGKKITHVVPSHHHRDHAGGIGDFLAAGAALVIPEVALKFYKDINGGDFRIITYNDDKPFVLKDNNVQFVSFWQNEAAHAEDWSYAIAAPACWTYESSGFVLFNADVVSPSIGPAKRWDTGYAREFLLNAIENGIPRSATILGAHGSSSMGLGTQDSLIHIAELAGVPYPYNEVQVEHKWCHEVGRSPN